MIKHEAPRHLPADAAARKNVPMARGLLDYFPLACAAVAELSRIGNEQHNPGEPMRWAREKSTDHADCIVRHLVERGTADTDGVLHDVKVAWRALALAQIALEAAASATATRRAKDHFQAIADRARRAQEAGNTTVVLQDLAYADPKPGVRLGGDGTYRPENSPVAVDRGYLVDTVG